MFRFQKKKKKKNGCLIMSSNARLENVPISFNPKTAGGGGSNWPPSSYGFSDAIPEEL